jgi:iron complex outermembrane receptor protein
MTATATAIRAVWVIGMMFGTLGTASFSAQAQSASQGVAASKRVYGIPAGPLERVLNSFAGAAGLDLSVEASLMQGKTSAGLAGSFTISEGFAELLRGQGLHVVRGAGGGYSLRPGAVPVERTSDSTLPVVTVTAAAERSAASGLQGEGQAADGYRATTVSSLGTLGSMNLLDVPFSISVVPQALMKNTLAQSPDDVYRLNPSTRTITPQGTGWLPIASIRGFNTSDSATDGLRRPSNYAAVLEDKERIEVLNGLSGFLYGAAAPAGMINYVYKRPTVERLNSLTVGNYGGSQYYAHGDFGGRFDEAGRAGYRLNIVKQDGETTVDDQKINRELVSGAIDWQITDQLKLELNAAYNRYRTTGPSAYWFYGAVPHGAVPDARKNWGQPWIHDEFENKELLGKLTYRLNDRVTLRGAYARNDSDRPVQDHTMNSIVSSTEYRQLRQRAGETKTKNDAMQAMADVDFATGSVDHKLTIGYHTYATESWATTYAPNTGYLGPYSLANPTYVPEAVFPPDRTSPYYSGKTTNRNIVVGDTIKFGDRWSALVGVNHSTIETESFNAAGLKSQPDYDKSRNSPSVAVLYKLASEVTTYASYIEGLERGGVAPVVTRNRDTIMAPMVSKQKELGVKANVSAMLLTAAVFDIEKAYEYTDANNVYTQSGRQNHKGLEFAATGKLTDRFTVVSGVTLLDTEINGGANSGKEPINVAKLVAKVYSEYELPVQGLSLTGGVYYTGKQWANATNTDRLPDFTTVDLGLRYATKVADKPLTLRLNISNVANKNYWLTSYYVGAPRAVALSAQLSF